MIRPVLRAAPVRQLVRAGAVLILGAAACERTPAVEQEGPRVLELTHDTIQLDSGTRLVEVSVLRSASGEFDPAAVDARQGDMVRFTAQDRGSHAIVFDGLALQPAARAFLERTGQLRSPPLITTGSAWVITLEDAPAGEYPFRCTTHDIAGRLRVAAR